MAVIPVALAGRAYDVVIEEGLLARLAEAAAPFLKGYGAARPVPFVADTNTHRLFAAGIDAHLAEHGLAADWFVVEPGEDAKTWGVLERLCDWLLALGVTRKDHVFAIGGGVAELVGSRWRAIPLSPELRTREQFDIALEPGRDGEDDTLWVASYGPGLYRCGSAADCTAVPIPGPGPRTDEIRTLRVRANADTPEDAERARGFGVEDDGRGQPVLHRGHRVEELELHEDFGVQAFRDLVQADERGVTDGVEDAIVDGHGVEL